MARVHERNGRAEDALARAEVVDELVRVAVHVGAVHGVHVGTLHRRRDEIAHKRGAVLADHQGVGRVGAHQERRLFFEHLVVVRAAQERLERLREECGLTRELIAEHLAVGVLAKVDVGLALEVAARVDDAAPERASLVPPVVRRVRAEHEQQGERRHRDRKRKRGKREVLDEGNFQGCDVAHAGEVVVARDEHVDRHHRHRNHCHRQDLSVQRAHHAAVER